MRTAEPATRRRLRLPTSAAGRWAVALFALSVAAVLFLWFTAVVHQPATFDQDPGLAVPAVLAAVCGGASAALGGWAVLRHDRALLVFLTVAADLNVLAYVLGEAIRAG